MHNYVGGNTNPHQSSTVGGNGDATAGGGGLNPFLMPHNHGQPSYATDLDDAATPPLDATPRASMMMGILSSDGEEEGSASSHHQHTHRHHHHRNPATISPLAPSATLGANFGTSPTERRSGNSCPKNMTSPSKKMTESSLSVNNSFYGGSARDHIHALLTGAPETIADREEQEAQIVKAASPSTSANVVATSSSLSVTRTTYASSNVVVLQQPVQNTTASLYDSLDGAALHTPAHRPAVAPAHFNQQQLPPLFGLYHNNNNSHDNLNNNANDDRSGKNIAAQSSSFGDGSSSVVNSAVVSQTLSSSSNARHQNQSQQQLMTPRPGSQVNEALIAYANTQLTMHAGVVASGRDGSSPPPETRSLLTAPRSHNSQNSGKATPLQSSHSSSNTKPSSLLFTAIRTKSVDRLQQQQLSSSSASSYCPAPEAATLPQSYGSPVQSNSHINMGESLLLLSVAKNRNNTSAIANANSNSLDKSLNNKEAALDATQIHHINVGNNNINDNDNNSIPPADAEVEATAAPNPPRLTEAELEARRQRDRALMMGAASSDALVTRLIEAATATAPQQLDNIITNNNHQHFSKNTHQTLSTFIAYSSKNNNNNGSTGNNSFVSASSSSQSHVPPPPSSPSPSMRRGGTVSAPFTPTLTGMLPDEFVPISVMMDYAAATSNTNSPSRSPTLGAEKRSVVTAAMAVVNNNSISGPDLGVVEINGKKVHVVYAPPRLDLPSPAQKPAAKFLVDRSAAPVVGGGNGASTTQTGAADANTSSKGRDLSVIVSSTTKTTADGNAGSGGGAGDKSTAKAVSSPAPAAEEEEEGFKIAHWKFYLACGVLMTDAVGTSMLYSYVGLLVAHVEPSLTAASSGYVAGILVGVFQAAQVLSMPVWGRMSDIVGRKPVMLTALFLSVSASLLFGFASSFMQLLVIRIIHGTVCAGISVGKTYIFEVTTPKTQAKGFGLMNLSWSLGSFIGPSVGGFLYDINNSPIFSKVLPHMDLFDTYPALGPALALSTYGVIIGLLAKCYLPESRPDCVPMGVAFGWFVDWLKVKFCCGTPPPPPKETCEMGTSPMAVEVDGSGGVRNRTPTRSAPVSPSLRGINMVPDATPNINPTVLYSLRLEPAVLHVESPRTGHFLDEVPIAIYTPQHAPVQIVYKNDEAVAEEQKKMEDAELSHNGSRAPSRRSSPSTTVIKMVPAPTAGAKNANEETAVEVAEVVDIDEEEDEYTGKPHADFHRLIDRANAELNEVPLISTKQILTHPLLKYTIPMGMLIAAVNITYNEVWPLYAIAYRASGGLGMTSTHIGIAGMMNAVIAVFVNGIFDKLCKRFKHMTLWAVCNFGIAIAMVLLGCFHYLPTTTVCLIAFVPFCLIRTPCSSILFGLSMMFNANASPKKHIGMVTSIAQSGQALARSITPMLAAPLFAWSVSGALGDGGATTQLVEVMTEANLVSNSSSLFSTTAEGAFAAAAEAESSGEVHMFPFNHFFVFLLATCIALSTVYMGKQLPNSVITVRRK